MISLGHLTVSLQDEVSTSSLNGEDIDGLADVTEGGPYDTDRTSVLEGLAELILIILSPNDPDFFLVSDCMLDFRLKDPNFSLSKTLLRRGEPSSYCDTASAVWLLPVGDSGGLLEVLRSIRNNSLTSFSNISLISAV